jgi:hypothetical protein
MPSVTKKFNTLKENTGWSFLNFVGNVGAGVATSTSTGNNFTLKDPIVNDTTSGNNSTFSSVIPSNAIITGIETRYLAHKQPDEESGGDVFVDNRLIIPSVSTGERQTHQVTSSLSSSPDVVSHGGTNNLQNLSGFTISDLDDIEWFVTTIISSNTLALTANLFEVLYSGFISPSVTIHYNDPSPTPALPGPNFISSNIDLTKFNGLGDKTSPLQSPPNSADLFGFTSTIILQEDENAKQATNSVYGDNANFGKLATNRGGSTGIDSTTGLVDTSKAPLSVRRGFAGI